MADDVKEDWPSGLIIAVPHAWRGNSLWSDIRAQTQDLIGVGLRLIYGELLQQPLSPRLQRLVCEIGLSLETLHMTVEASLREALLATIPCLRAFAMSFTNNRDCADDLVQETILRAWANIDKFQPGTNLYVWLFTILRNLSHCEYRKRKY